MPGFSLLGNQVPAASSVDPRLNLNNQAWSLPSNDNVHASLRVQQRLAGAWRLKAQAATQRLHTNDRPHRIPVWLHRHHRYWWADRYCPDGF